MLASSDIGQLRCWPVHSFASSDVSQIGCWPAKMLASLDIIQPRCWSVHIWATFVVSQLKTLINAWSGVSIKLIYLAHETALHAMLHKKCWPYVVQCVYCKVWVGPIIVMMGQMSFWPSSLTKLLAEFSRNQRPL